MELYNCTLLGTTIGSITDLFYNFKSYFPREDEDNLLNNNLSDIFYNYTNLAGNTSINLE